MLCGLVAITWGGERSTAGAAIGDGVCARARDAAVISLHAEPRRVRLTAGEGGSSRYSRSRAGLDVSNPSGGKEEPGQDDFQTPAGHPLIVPAHPAVAPLIVPPNPFAQVWRCACGSPPRTVGITQACGIELTLASTHQQTPWAASSFSGSDRRNMGEREHERDPSQGWHRSRDRDTQGAKREAWRAVAGTQSQHEGGNFLLEQKIRRSSDAEASRPLIIPPLPHLTTPAFPHSTLPPSSFTPHLGPAAQATERRGGERVHGVGSNERRRGQSKQREGEGGSEGGEDGKGDKVRLSTSYSMPSTPPSRAALPRERGVDGKEYDTQGLPGTREGSAETRSGGGLGASRRGGQGRAGLPCAPDDHLYPPASFEPWRGAAEGAGADGGAGDGEEEGEEGPALEGVGEEWHVAASGDHGVLQGVGGRCGAGECAEPVAASKEQDALQVRNSALNHPERGPFHLKGDLLIAALDGGEGH